MCPIYVVQSQSLITVDVNAYQFLHSSTYQFSNTPVYSLLSSITNWKYQTYDIEIQELTLVGLVTLFNGLAV